MNCFSNRPSSNIFDSCCNGANLCEFSGNLDDVVSVPVYVQTVYDAVQSNLQGMRTIQNQTFTPAIPSGFTVSRVADIRTKAFFNPANISDPRNLTTDLETSLSGATFLQDSQGNVIEVSGPDGTGSQKILCADSNCCDESCKGTPIFGTQNVQIHGNVQVFVDLILCNNCNHETRFTVCAEVPIATSANPLTLTNFFEVCMPASQDHAFLPRFTELTAISCEARLATNNCGRDLTMDSNGELVGNLIVALCVSTEKKVVAPVQICVLSTGMAEIPTQTNSICNGFPTMFADGITAADTEANCGCGNNNNFPPRPPKNNGCGPKPAPNCAPKPPNDCGCNPRPANDCGCEPKPIDDCGCAPHPIDDCGCSSRPIR